MAASPLLPKINFGIRTRLIVLVVALLLPFLVLILHAAKTEDASARTRALQDTLVFARLFSARIDDHVSQIGQLLNTLSHGVSIDPAATIQNDKFLGTLKQGLPRYISEMTVWTPTGDNIGNLSPVAERAKRHVGDWQFFKNALNKRGWAVDGPFSPPGSREFTMLFTQTVVDIDGRIIGVVSASILLSEFQDVVARGTTLPDGTVTTLLDPQGIVLARSLNSQIWLGETLIGTQGIQQALKQRESSLALHAEDGMPRLAGFSTATRVPWMVYVGTPTEVALAPVTQQLRDRLLVSGAVLLGLLLTALFLGERISMPLRQLAADAKKIGEGALDHRTPVVARWEAGVLATSLNHMAAAIQARTNALSASEAAARRAEHALTESESRLRRSETRMRTIIESVPDLVVVLSRNGHILEINAAGLHFVEAKSIKEIDDKDVSFLGATDHQTIIHAMHQRVIAGETVRFDFELVGLRGARRWMSCIATPLRDVQGDVIGQLAIARDITERKQSVDRIEHLATRDTLTDLPNRALLGDRLQQALAAAHRDGKPLAIMFIDLDRFKTINDSLGHHAGDAVLCETARRLTSCLRENDTVARQGGDEFIVLLPDSQGTDAALVASKILNTISLPIAFDSHQLEIQASIGIALYPENGEEVSTLMRNADAAMYHAKAAGRNNYQFFLSGINETVQMRLVLENALRRALASDELRLRYQPQVSLVNGEVAGYEALVRWEHPQRGLIPPAEFIPVAEESGLIIALGDWVLRESCRQAALWQHSGRRFRLAVNVSAQQFRQKDFSVALLRLLADTGYDPHLLELEITEDTLIKQHDDVIAVMSALSRAGVTLSIEHFGTGYSSLTYLKRLPIRKIKIDPSFVHDLDNPDAATIVRATIQLARSLSLQVVAEGIESAAQLEFLRAAGCDLGQGFHTGRPLPPVS